MELLKEYVKLIVEATVFEEWLSPEIVKLLISEYAKTSSKLGVLTWKYVDSLGARTWGVYSGDHKKLYVSSAKTKNLFKQQVTTILHEIQHWNQHVEIAENNPDNPISTFHRTYEKEVRLYGYWKSPMEVGARQFSEDNIEDAMQKIGNFYGQKLEGGSLDGVVEELVDEFIDGGEKPLSRARIGHALKEYDLNSMQNIKTVISKLSELGVKIV